MPITSLEKSLQARVWKHTQGLQTGNKNLGCLDGTEMFDCRSGSEYDM